MGDDKKPRTGHYLIGSAFLWAAAHWAVAWFVTDLPLFPAIAASGGGLVAGWCTALALGRIAKWGATAKMMIVFGLVLGIAFSSGAVTGLNYAISGFKPESVKIDWESFQKFVLSTAAVPAVALGVLTGLYVRSSIPRPKPKKS